MKPNENELNQLQPDNFLNRLRSCLIVQAKYKEAFRNLRDALGGSQALSSFPSVSSVQASEHSLSQTDLKKKHSISLRRIGAESSSSKSHGILMSEEEIIFAHMDTFCNRVKCVIDQIVSLAQFQLLFKTSSGLTRPKKEDLGIEDLEEEAEIQEDEADEEEDETEINSEINRLKLDDIETYAGNKAILDILVEENEENSILNQSLTPHKSILKKNDTKADKTSNEFEEGANSDFEEHDLNKKLIKSAEALFKMEQKTEAESKAILKKAQTLSKDDIKLMKKYYNKNEGPTVQSVISSYISQITRIIKSVNASQLMDVETKEANIFQESYRTFLSCQISLEKFLAAYLNIIFVKTKKTHDGLNILTKFKAVSQRNILRPIINDKYVEIFANYERDLADAEKVFESSKERPPLLRNAPPIGGAISWVRQLLRNIEEPIKVFKDNKYITSLGDFAVTFKKYHKLSSAMISFENNFLSQWRSSIDEAKIGLRSCLLCKNDEQFVFSVNFDEKLLLLFEEAKWLSRMNIELPQAAKDLLAQEKKYKLYKSNLEMLVIEYRKVMRQIPTHLFSLYHSHIRQTLDLVNPGCFILTWNSLNIDSFLKTVELGIRKLNDLVLLVRDSKEKSIYTTIDSIASLCLFDEELAFSKRWNPEDFLETIGKSIDEKSRILNEKISQIENEIEEIGSLLVVLPRDQNASRKRSRMTLREFIEIEPKLGHLKDFYSVKLYEAFCRSVQNSLNCLAEACGYSIEFEEDLPQNESIIDFFGSQKQTEQASNSALNEATLKFIRLKSAEDVKSELRPLSATSAICKATWSDERKLEDAYLNLEFVLKYSIPEIITEPNLEECQKVVKSISRSIIDTSKGKY